MSFEISDQHKGSLELIKVTLRMQSSRYQCDIDIIERNDDVLEFMGTQFIFLCLLWKPTRGEEYE
jgi:hypothetical protein